MPTRATKHCPRCHSPAPQGRCPTCTARRQHRTDLERPRAARRGYNQQWTQASRRYLATLDHCECDGCARCTHPRAHCQAVPTQTDHVDGQGPNSPRGYDPANWQGLCSSCHSHKTASQDGGYGNNPRDQNGHRVGGRVEPGSEAN